MSHHKSEDYKLSAIKYYIKNKISMEKVYQIFGCKKQSLSRWVQKYKLQKISKEITENLFLIKLQKNKLNMLLKN